MNADTQPSATAELLKPYLPIAPRFAMGTKFKPIGKDYVCTVTDFLITFNTAGVIVKRAYCASHLFCGQTVTNTDVPEATIARGLIQPMEDRS